MKDVLTRGRELIAQSPPTADPSQLMLGCMLLVTVNTNKLDWTDWTAIALASFNFGYYVYASRRYKAWERKRDEWVKQLTPADFGAKGDGVTDDSESLRRYVAAKTVKP